MPRRYYLASLLVLGLGAVSGHAAAHLQIPATAGTARNLAKMNQLYWSLMPDGYVYELMFAPVDWIIPLPFHGDSGNNTWKVSIMASAGTTCSIEWRADAIPTAPTPPPIAEGSTPVTQTVDGPLTLTFDPANPATPHCPTQNPLGGCITSFSTAYVTCSVNRGYVGAVTYTIMP